SLLLLGLFAAVALTACGPGSTSSNGSASRGGAVTLVPPPQRPWAVNFNPLLSGKNNPPRTQGMILETPLYLHRLDGSIHPWLADSYTWAPDASSVTFKLRPGVMWSDGQPFTSQDVLFSLNLSKQYPALDLNSLWQVIQSASAPDARTVVITFKRPAAP